MANGDYNRKKENYYEMTLYFSSSKVEEASLYFFLKQLSQRRKATSFITKVLGEYLGICGYKDPTELKYENVEKLPKIKELIEKGNTNMSPVDFMRMFSAFMQHNGEDPKTLMTDTDDFAHNDSKSTREDIKKNTPSKKVPDDNSADDGETQESENSIDSSWMQGLSMFTDI